jgi:hypothetical protein
MQKWENCGTKLDVAYFKLRVQPLPEEYEETSKKLRIASLWNKIRTRDLPHTKQECSPLRAIIQNSEIVDCL